MKIFIKMYLSNNKKMVKKFFLTGIFVTILISAVASAGLFDFFKDVRQGPVDVGVTVQSVAPTIFYVSDVAGDVLNTFGTVSPRGGGGVTITRVSFIAEDLNGASDLNDAGAKMSYLFGGNMIEGSCTNVPCNGCPVTQKNYSCNVDMQYYYSPGNWNVNATAEDNSGNKISDTLKTFQYLQYQELSHPGNLNWAGISLVNPNQPSDSNPLTMTNLGNVALSLAVTGYELQGTVNPFDAIPADYFSASAITGGIPPAECDVPGQAASLIESTPITISGISIPVGSSGNNQDDMFFCLYPSLSQLNLDPSQSYSTTASGNQWVLTII